MTGSICGALPTFSAAVPSTALGPHNTNTHRHTQVPLPMTNITPTRSQPCPRPIAVRGGARWPQQFEVIITTPLGLVGVHDAPGLVWDAPTGRESFLRGNACHESAQAVEWQRE